MKLVGVLVRVGVVGMLSATAVGLSAILPTAPASAADIRACEFGTGQVFDVQWNIQGSQLNVSGMNYPFSNYGMYSPDPPATRFDSSTLATDDYFEFFDSTTTPGTLGLELFDGGGTLLGVIDDTGSFQALGNGFIFYVGDGSWGTLLTTQKGFQYGDSASFTATNTSPSTADALAFTSCQTAPVTEPVIGPGSPHSGTVGTPYAAFSVPTNAATGFTYAVTGGTLPPGLSLDPATGTITGTPTKAGSSTFTVTVTGATGTATKTYTITVSASSALPVTGVDASGPLTFALFALTAGVVLTMRRRRRAHYNSSASSSSSLSP